MLVKIDCKSTFVWFCLLPSSCLCLGSEGSYPQNFLSAFQDEQSSVAMLKKHQILEQAVEDYADTVHQLSSTSRGLVAAGHPDR